MYSTQCVTETIFGVCVCVCVYIGGKVGWCHMVDGLKATKEQQFPRTKDPVVCAMYVYGRKCVA